MAETTGHGWLKVKQAAKRANVCDWTIYRACESGQLRHVKVGGRRAIRLTCAAVDEWLQRHELAPTANADDRGARQ
jgi:excisionase family DNA binding protein